MAQVAGSVGIGPAPDAGAASGVARRREPPRTAARPRAALTGPGRSTWPPGRMPAHAAARPVTGAKAARAWLVAVTGSLEAAARRAGSAVPRRPRRDRSRRADQSGRPGRPGRGRRAPSPSMPRPGLVDLRCRSDWQGLDAGARRRGPHASRSTTMVALTVGTAGDDGAGRLVGRCGGHEPAERDRSPLRTVRPRRPLTRRGTRRPRRRPRQPLGRADDVPADEGPGGREQPVGQDPVAAGQPAPVPFVRRGIGRRRPRRRRPGRRPGRSGCPHRSGRRRSPRRRRPAAPGRPPAVGPRWRSGRPRGPAWPTAGAGRARLAQARHLGQQLVVRRPRSAEDGDADQVRRDRGDVGLGQRAPVHLDVLAPGRDREVPALAEPATPAGPAGGSSPSRAPDRGVQAVAGQQPAAGEPADPHRVARPASTCSTRRLDPLDPQLGGPRRPGQPAASVRRTPEPGPGPERVPRNVFGVDVGDPANGTPAGWTPSRSQRGDRARHQSLAAGLVDRPGARLDDRDRQPALRRLDRAGQADRAGAGDEDVVRRLTRPAARARCSAGMRSESTTASSTLNTTAVTQAVCTSGSAATSSDHGDVVGMAQPAGRARGRPAAGRARRRSGCSTAARGCGRTTSAGAWVPATTASIGQPRARARTAGRRRRPRRRRRPAAGCAPRPSTGSARRRTRPRRAPGPSAGGGRRRPARRPARRPPRRRAG